MPHWLRMLRLGEQLGDVQQRLGGNAAAVRADAARVDLLVDQRDRHAEVGGEERGRVAARPRAQHDEWCGVCHKVFEATADCSAAYA